MVASRIAFLSISISLSLAYDSVSGKELKYYERNLSSMAFLAKEVYSNEDAYTFDSSTSPQLTYREGDRFLSIENAITDICYYNSMVVAADEMISFRYEFVLECTLDPCSNDLLEKIELSIQDIFLNVSENSSNCYVSSEDMVEVALLEDTTNVTAFVGVTHLPDDRFSCEYQRCTLCYNYHLHC